MGFFSKTLDKLKGALKKTAEVLNTDVRTLFVPGRQIDDSFLAEMEEKFIRADMGVGRSEELVSAVREGRAPHVTGADGRRALALATRVAGAIAAGGAASSARCSPARRSWSAECSWRPSHSSRSRSPSGSRRARRSPPLRSRAAPSTTPRG